MNQYNVSAIDSSVSVGSDSLKVLRNTYLLLGLTMIPTIIGAFIGMSMNFGFAAQHPLMFGLGALAVMMGLFFGISATRDSAMGVVLLLVLTGVMGVLLQAPRNATAVMQPRSARRLIFFIRTSIQ